MGSRRRDSSDGVMSRSRKDSGGSDAPSRIPISSTPVLPRKRPTLERHRSLQSLSTGARGSPNRYEDDNESLRSGISCCSSASQCDHAHFARNGTTYSGRANKYIVHCSPTHTEPDQYLTPTQRAKATIRHLQTELSKSYTAIQEKELEISRLTRELVELRLGQAEANGSASPVPKSSVNSHAKGGGYPIDRNLDLTPSSLGDSGHFEDISILASPKNTPNGDLGAKTSSPVKKAAADVDSLVQLLSEANARYAELRPQYESLQERIDQLEKENEEVNRKFKENEEKHKKTYLDMFNKGQEAALFEVTDSVSATDGPPKTDLLPKILKELEVTKSELESVRDLEFWRNRRSLSGQEAVSIWNLCRKTMYRRLIESKRSKPEQDAEVTLQFLKSAFYYFLTDRENTTGHLAAIQSILGFSQEEKSAIEKASYGFK